MPTKVKPAEPATRVQCSCGFVTETKGGDHIAKCAHCGKALQLPLAPTWVGVA